MLKILKKGTKYRRLRLINHQNKKDCKSNSSLRFCNQCYYYYLQQRGWESNPQ